jgi:hypothetical protein
MIDHSLRVALCHSITARAHLAGAEAGDAARRRYWREQAACELFHGRRWPEAEGLGVEPPAMVSTSQED